LAAMTFVILAGTTLDWLGYVLGATTLLWLGYQAVAREHVGRPTELSLLVAGLVAHEVSVSSATVEWPFALAGLLLIVAIVNEPELGRARTRTIQTANIEVGRSVRSMRTPAALLNIVAVAAFEAGVIADVSPWLFVTSFGLLCLGYGIAALMVIRRRSGVDADPVRAALERHRPAFVVYHSAPKNSEYQVTMWLPYLEKIGKPFFVLLREPDGLAPIAAATGQPVVYCPTIAALDDAMVPSVQTAFYVNNGMKNTHLVRFHELTHIQLLHGDSDKPPSYNPVTGMFDRIFVAGQAAIDRYAHKGVVIPPEKFRIVGRPQVASIEPARGRIWDLTDKVVLYAPTWTGYFNDTNYCSLPVAEPLLRELLEHKATVILRAHPYTSKNRQSVAQLAKLEAMLAEDQATSGRQHIWGAAADTDMSIVECFNRSDALVADVSSVVSDYLFSGKPFAITDITGDGDAFADNFPLAKAAYVLKSDMSNAADVMTSLLETDPADEVRQSMRAYYLGDFPKESYEEVFVEEARKYL
jgi:hypothetical protein